MGEKPNDGADATESGTPEFLLIEHFEPHVGKVFRFAGTRYALPLSRIVSPRRPVPAWMKRRPFTLIFRAPKEREWLPEGLYDCAVDGGPTYKIYVAPIHTPESTFQDYQAVFN